MTAGEAEISKGDAGFVKKTILAAREMVQLIEAGKVSFGEQTIRMSISVSVCVYVCVYMTQSETACACASSRSP